MVMLHTGKMRLYAARHVQNSSGRHARPLPIWGGGSGFSGPRGGAGGGGRGPRRLCSIGDSGDGGNKPTGGLAGLWQAYLDAMESSPVSVASLRRTRHAVAAS